VGRIGSLLEVGTGFHPELTGRENVFLNGSILGMSRREISAKFDEIVAFSEIERFLDTPVSATPRHVRPAGLRRAAHLEPEILIVDEVLAWRRFFPKEVPGKMGEVATTGRTVLFVSHNMGAIRACVRAACGSTPANWPSTATRRWPSHATSTVLRSAVSTARARGPITSRCKSPALC